MLGTAYRVRLVQRWASGEDGDAELMIALHARRSAASIAAWHAARPQRPVLLVLTGTDLYRDIDTDADAQRSLLLAHRLVVLNELGIDRLPPALRGKCRVVLQSCLARPAVAKSPQYVCALMVGHLREEKDPRTFFRAVRALADRADLRFEHIGAPLDPVLGDEAKALAAAHSRYRWRGALPYGETRRRIQAAHVLVHASHMEGGAHVVIEAVRSGTPVLASRIDGNVGLLGENYAGYFPPGDDATLAGLLRRARDDRDMLPLLQRQIDERAPRFAPEAEAATVHRLVAESLALQSAR